MRRRAKRDGNHAEIVRALRAHGRRVLELHQVGGGCPDLLVGWGGGMLLMEVKNPDGRDTIEPGQRAFFDQWRGHVCVVRSVEEALAATGVVVSRPRVPGPPKAA